MSLRAARGKCVHGNETFADLILFFGDGNSRQRDRGRAEDGVGHAVENFFIRRNNRG